MRKLSEVIRGCIGDGFAGTQSDLVQELKRRGYVVNQSTVSRYLKKLSVSTESHGDQKIYTIKVDKMSSSRSAARSFKDIVFSVSSNETLVVVKTKADFAMFVAGFIDHGLEGEVLGTVAGSDTFIVIPKKGSSTQHTAGLIRRKLGVN
jgi:transcriptional regulator of arginine metabolism